MARAIWTGLLQFVLISFPVKIYKATTDKGLSFKTFHSTCGSSIRLKKWCETCAKEVLATELNKGYEIAKEKYVMFTEEEIENALPETSKVIKIEKAVVADEIPVITYEDSYFLAPDKGGDHVYNLLLNALAMKGKVLIGRLTMRSKEHLIAIRPYYGGLLLSMLHFAEDVRDIQEVTVLKDKNVDKKELDLAASLIDYLTGPFKDINQKDVYREYIQTMAGLKAEGQVITIEKRKPVMTTGSLVEALQNSIKSIETSKEAIKVGEINKVPEMIKAVPEISVGDKVGDMSRAGPKVEIPIKLQLDQMFGVTEEEINKIILEQKIEDEQERINTLKELVNCKSFEDYVKEHKKEFEGIEISDDFYMINIDDKIYPKINLPLLKKIGVVANHYGVLIYVKSSKKQVVPTVKGDILKFL